jgi:hypothetical protein
MRVSIIAILAVCITLGACSDAGWEVSSSEPPFDLESYGPPSSRNPDLRQIVDAFFERERETANENVAAYLNCPDFAYRAHLTTPEQYLVRCYRDGLFVVFRDGQPLAMRSGNFF